MKTFVIILVLCAVITVVFMIKKLKFNQIVLCLLSGMAALFASDIILSLYGENMPLNIYTVLISAIGGIPAVILLLLLKTFMLY